MNCIKIYQNCGQVKNVPDRNEGCFKEGGWKILNLSNSHINSFQYRDEGVYQDLVPFDYVIYFVKISYDVVYEVLQFLTLIWLHLIMLHDSLSDWNDTSLGKHEITGKEVLYSIV